MQFFKCKTPEELIEAIEKNPTYILLNRWSEDYSYGVGIPYFLKVGCKEPIRFEPPDFIARAVGVCFLAFSDNGYDISGKKEFTGDYFIDIQNVLLWCKDYVGVVV